MISLSKLEKMALAPRKRKVAALLREFARSAREGKAERWSYWLKILHLGVDLSGAETERPLPDPKEVEPLQSEAPAGWDLAYLARFADEVAWNLFAQVGIDAADWNLYTTSDNFSWGRTFPIQLYLDQIRSPYNLGAIFRTAAAFGVEKIILSKDCPEPNHPRCRRTAMGATDWIAWERSESLPNGLALFGLESGGRDIETFEFPPRGVAALGSEEWGLRPQTLASCRSSLGLVSIPLPGKKASLNVAAAAAILLQRWTGKINTPPTSPGFDP